MRCDEFEGRLHEILDAHGAVEGDDVLEAHSATCESCRDLMDAYRHLLTTWQVTTPPAPSSDLADRVCARLPVKPAGRRERSWLVGLVGLAAAALLITLPSLWTTPTGDVATPPAAPSRSSDLAAVQAPMPATPNTPQAGAPEASAERMRIMLASLAGQIGEVKLPLDGVNTITTTGLRPIANSLESAITALRNSLPLIKSEEPRKPQASLGQLRAVA